MTSDIGFRTSDVKPSTESIVWLPFILSFLVLSTTACGGANPDGTAWLSWDINEVVCDLDTMPAGFTWLNIQLGNISELAGCEFILKWAPPGPPGSTCFEFTLGEHPSGFGELCTWLMRGNQVEGVDLSDDHSWLIAFAGNECNTLCSGGNVARVMIDFNGCAGNPEGRFCLEYVKVTDCSSIIEVLSIIGSVTVLGGQGVECPCGFPGEDDCCPGCDWADVSIRRSTWGSIKAVYK